MHTDTFYKGEVATTNITYIIYPLSVYDEVGGARTDRPKALLQVKDIHGFSLAAVWTGLFDCDNVSLPLCAVL
jgi:hypothetical protein